MDVSIAAEPAVGHPGWRIRSACDLGALHYHLADHGHRYIYQPRGADRHSVFRASDSREFQSAHQTGWLLHAERLPGDSEPAREGAQRSMGPDFGQAKRAALPGRTRASHLWNCFGGFLDNSVSVRLHGPVYLGDLAVRFCWTGWFYNV